LLKISIIFKATILEDCKGHSDEVRRYHYHVWIQELIILLITFQEYALINEFI